LRRFVGSLESLETRRFLCANLHNVPADLAPYVRASDAHISAADFVKVRTQYAGADLWDPAVFNPTNSTNPSEWLYDPRFIEDGRPAHLPDAPALTAGPEADSLPDVTPLTGGSYLNPFIDTTEIPGRNLMRFQTGIGNMGQGPNILVSNNSGSPPAGSGITSWINPDGSQNVLQQIYTYDPAGNGSFSFTRYRPAGKMVYHSTHGHFHLEGYAAYKLRTNVGGLPGPVALRADGTEAVGDKIGFCMINTDSSFTLPGGGSSSGLPGFNDIGQPSTACGFTQGIHVGKGDTYSSIYDGQWVDVTGVPNGSYFLEVTVDALNVIEESNESNNTVAVPVTLNANPPVGGIQPDRFEPNNSFAQATDLGVLGVQTQSGLTIHTTNGDDFFRFEAASSGTYQVRLTIGDRDVNLYVYNGSQTLLASSTSPTSGGSETVNVNFVAGQTYYVLAQGFGTSQGTSGVSNNYALVVSVNPTVNAAAPDALASEFGSNSGFINIARNGPISSALSVNFAVSGSATRGTDYAIYQDGFLITGNSLVIGVEASQASLEVRPLADGDVEAAENMSLTVTTDSAYVIGGTAAAQVTIDDTPPQVEQTTQVWQTSPHKLFFKFTLDVGASLTAEDLVVVNQDTREEVAPAEFVYDAGTRTATVTFSGVLVDGHYNAALSGAGITHALGAPMPSDYSVDFFVLTGDANHSGFVDSDDFNILAANFGTTGKDGSQGDFDYDSDVDSDDFNILAGRFGTGLATSSVQFKGVNQRRNAGLFSDGRGIDQDDKLPALV
jgi:hypothetical protein